MSSHSLVGCWLLRWQPASVDSRLEEVVLSFREREGMTVVGGRNDPLALYWRAEGGGREVPVLVPIGGWCHVTPESRLRKGCRGRWWRWR